MFHLRHLRTMRRRSAGTRTRKPSPPNAMQKYASADLTTFSPTRARDFGRRGVPADIAAAAKEHPVKGCALVKTRPDVKRAVLQGYPVAVCSDQGFRMERDSTGRCRPQG